MREDGRRFRGEGGEGLKDIQACRVENKFSVARNVEYGIVFVTVSYCESQQSSFSLFFI